MLKKLLVTSLASLSLAMAGTLTLDDFSVAQGPGALSGSGSAAAVAIGGGVTREQALTSIPGGVAPTEHSLSSTGGAGGILDITNGLGDDSTVVITYSLPGALAIPVGATNVQLTLLIVGSDGNPTSVTLGGTAGVSGAFAIPGNTVGQTVPFGVTIPVGPGTITMTFDGSAGWDLGIDSIGFSWTDPQTTVPEPGTYAMIGLGLAGLAFLRRK